MNDGEDIKRLAYDIALLLEERTKTYSIRSRFAVAMTALDHVVAAHFQGFDQEGREFAVKAHADNVMAILTKVDLKRAKGGTDDQTEEAPADERLQLHHSKVALRRTD